MAQKVLTRKIRTLGKRATVSRAVIKHVIRALEDESRRLDKAVRTLDSVVGTFHSRQVAPMKPTGRKSPGRRGRLGKRWTVSLAGSVAKPRLLGRRPTDKGRRPLAGRSRAK